MQRLLGGPHRVACALLAALFALGALAQGVAAVRDVQDTGPAAVTAPLPAAAERTTITNETTAEILKELATPHKEVLLAVVQLSEGKALDFVKNWALSLQAHDLLRHTLLVVVDDNSLKIAQSAGLPALLDKAFPTDAGPWTLQRQWIITNRIYDVSKHWWGMRVVEHGYSVLYMDVDMVLLKDPLPYLRAAPYDVQGLSDYFGPELLPVGGVLDKPCDFYKLVAEGQSPTGSQVREIWGFRGNDKHTALQVLNPCQSTGLWHVKPTKVGVAFMEAMVHRLFTLPWGWDQSTWQEVVMAFLIGMGEEPPLRLRILPVDKFANTGVFKDRLQANLTVDPIILHGGAVNGFDPKICAFAELNLWHPELWQAGLQPNSVHTASMVCTGRDKKLGKEGSVANLTFPVPGSLEQIRQRADRVLAAGGAALQELVPTLLAEGATARGGVSPRLLAAAPAVCVVAVLVVAWSRGRSSKRRRS